MKGGSDRIPTNSIKNDIFAAMRRPNAILPLLLTLLTVGLAACGGASDESSSDSTATAGSGGGGGASATLSLVAYSTPEVVYDEIIPDFQKTSEGRNVKFKTSFGASGEQSRAVEGGLPADVVSFSIEPDMERLVKADLVDAGWKNAQHDGLVTTSVVSFIVRKGNPKNIKTWDDLLRKGIKVITPNPFTSGAAKWNLLGAYQHGGLEFVDKLIKDHVEVQPKSGREALQAFTAGEGDVLLSYEYEATTAQKKGEDVEYVIPPDTLKIDITIARTKEAPGAAQTFLSYLQGDAAQQRFADWGYRPVNEAILEKNKDKFPEPQELKTIDDLGGWSKVNDELFDPEKGSIAKIEEEAGVSTAK
ncbi:MAG: Sulfate and thiosulfate binding protein CysP [uncultured Solirubrobacteraceae bacterium]|uniref:Sulfate and thiosulfate binding protein CysP n=1 Tax=uncultured Solirubrobacteraceae bacterium TaxID=1162706 RepID=A0A6J4RVV7_9ACTN|nr:MAG: Sulfate and thiosulfate binding protein CysP [uncultured Solirubrobacteraceae bacterium]